MLLNTVLSVVEMHSCAELFRDCSCINYDRLELRPECTGQFKLPFFNIDLKSVHTG